MLLILTILYYTNICCYQKYSVFVTCFIYKHYLAFIALLHIFIHQINFLFYYFLLNSLKFEDKHQQDKLWKEKQLSEKHNSSSLCHFSNGASINYTYSPEQQQQQNLYRLQQF